VRDAESCGGGTDVGSVALDMAGCCCSSDSFEADSIVGHGGGGMVVFVTMMA
jgi:hypothetical protein